MNNKASIAIWDRRQKLDIEWSWLSWSWFPTLLRMACLIQYTNRNFLKLEWTFYRWKVKKRLLDKMDSHFYVIDNLCKLFQTLDKECIKFESTRVNTRSYHCWITLTYPSGVPATVWGKSMKFFGVNPWNFNEAFAPWW